MKKVLIFVEGQTEERFVKVILRDYLYKQGTFIIPYIIETKEVKSGPNFKGGINSYRKIKKDLYKLFNDTSVATITTMIDYYGLPSDFPAFSQGDDCYSKVESAEEAFAQDINKNRFLPYLQLHEFEGLLFSAPEEISNTMDTTGRSIAQIQLIRNNFNSPEEINDGVETHPSKRILTLFPNYNKPFHGELISSRIGIDQLLADCSHFSQWIKKLT